MDLKQGWNWGMARWLGLTLLALVLDQLTKAWASGALEYAQPLAVMPMFNLTLLHNTGAAFSFLAQAGGWQRWFFAGVALLVSVVLLVWLLRVRVGKGIEAAGLALILGGALGNLYDRVAYGYVVDFIDVYYQQWHWPAFNIADSAITLGVGLLLVDALLLARKEAAKE